MPAPNLQLPRSSSAPTGVGILAHQPATADERRTDIDRLSQKIVGLAQSMCAMKDLPGTSAEVRDKALTAFHERLVAAEKHLAHIHDRLRLE